MHEFAAVGLAVGGWMREHLPPDTLITVGAAGAVPYASGLPVIDAYGLVDPIIAHLPDVRPRTDVKARPGHQLLAPVDYIKARDPDLLCHVGYRGARRPSPRQTHPAFARGYTWACIEPGSELGFYCCRRPVDRTVGPFGPPGMRGDAP
jgi:arabinofuranosyltransferase